MRVVFVAMAGLFLLGSAPTWSPSGLAVGTCEYPATPSLVAGTIIDSLENGETDTWAYDMGEDGVVVQGHALGGRVRVTFNDSCGPADCSHEGPTIPPAGLGTLFPGPGCDLSKGFVTVSQVTPSLTGTTHYWLRLCPGSVAIAAAAGTCPQV